MSFVWESGNFADQKGGVTKRVVGDGTSDRVAKVRGTSWPTTFDRTSLLWMTLRGFVF